MITRTLPSSAARSAAGLLAAYVTAVFLASALGAPWLYRAARAAAAHAPVLGPLAEHPLHRYVQRLLLVFAVATLPTLLRALGLRGWRDLGLARPAVHRRAFATGALVGVATILAAAALALTAGARMLDPAVTFGRVAGRVLTAFAVAPAVALLEEFLFRAIIDGGLRRARAPAAALAASSAFYAAVHFLAHPPTPATVTWSSGLTVLLEMLGGLGAVDGHVVPAFLTLWVVGASLGGLYQRAGTLYANIGVHAGGIFVLQLYGLVTTEAPGADSRLWGTGRLVDGWVALGVVLAACGVARAMRARCVPQRASEAPLDLEQATLAA